MSKPNTFEEASAATEEMFADLETEENVPENGSVEEGAQGVGDDGLHAPDEDSAEPVDDGQAVIAENPQMLEDAVSTAEQAAQAAAQMNSQLQQAMADIDALKQQNQQLQGTIDEMSQTNEEKTIEEALVPPTLDINSLAFADEDTQKAAMAKYAEELYAYNKNELMKELSPALEYAKKGMYESEKAEAVNVLSQLPELSGIRDMMPQIEKIIASNKWLQSEDMSIDEKLINAFAIAQGVNSMNTPPPEPPKEPTTDELMELYNSNPEFRDMVEKQRIGEIKKSQQVPPFSASSGAVNAALDIKEKPQTLEEASKRTREMFGTM